MAEGMFGPYRLDGLIGRGGMGEVHRAFDTGHNRMVALKLLAEHLCADDLFRTRFRREAEIVASGEVDDRPVVVSGGEDGTLRMSDPRTGEALGAPLTGHRGHVLAAATTGGQLVSGGDDGTVRFWDLRGHLA